MSSSSEMSEESVEKKEKEKKSLQDLLSPNEDEIDGPKRKKRRPIQTDSLMENGKKVNWKKNEDSRLYDIRKAKELYKPKCSLDALRKSKEVFVQYKRCIDFKNKRPNVSTCLECKHQPDGESKITIEKCRFYGLRKLSVTQKGVSSEGLPDPYTDPVDDDKNLWKPLVHSSVTKIDVDTSKFIATFVGDQFCDLVQEENMTMSKKINEEPIVWKRVVKSVREMCDVCCTTLFNYQWICDKCGFVACRDCFRARFLNEVKQCTSHESAVDDFLWMKCFASKTSTPHILDDLRLAQMVTGDSLNELHTLVHKIRHECSITQSCGCSEALKYASLPQPPPTQNARPTTSKALSSLLAADDSSEDSSDDDLMVDKDLVSLLSSSATTPNHSLNKTSNASGNAQISIQTTKPINAYLNGDSTRGKLSSVIRPLSHPKYLLETEALYPTISHLWHCNGKLLRLLDPSNPENYKLFQDVWKCGQPVLISNVDSKLDKSLWTPESFIRDFGKMNGVFVNCMNGKMVMNQLMEVFWGGFEMVPERLKDEQGNTMLLKLKDWPEKADFADVLPSRFKDIMSALPLQDYTSREGRFNLTSYLPDKFVKPDLGPKMYVAYGSGLHLDKGTTNLHLDISDAVNVMVYIGEPKDTPENTSKHHEAVIEAIKDSDCDRSTIQRVIEGKDVPGALWHIYEARDADAIRNFLNENKVQQGIRPEDRADPIHDQSYYLDKKLRLDLMTRYNICGYPIIQCAGDAIFIPAGAPHQVRNLQNCIKVAEDFVSPENVHRCFQLTGEFRKLSDLHSNHEDKLQIKNIIYHSVKDAVAKLLHAKKSEDDLSGQVESDEVQAIPSPPIVDILSD